MSLTTDSAAALEDGMEKDETTIPSPDKGTVIAESKIFTMALISALVLTFAYNLSAQSGAGWKDDLLRQHPKSGEAGHGKFEIRGFDGDGKIPYAWRLVDLDAVGITLQWLLYLIHQFGMWAIIYYAKIEKARLLEEKKIPRWGNGLDKWNWRMIGLNAFGIIGHWIISLVWYDGLAANMPKSYSQSSVIILLTVVIVMEIPRRGIILGHGKSFSAIGKECNKALFHYAKSAHGYWIAYGIVFTFHYHPVESTLAFLGGYFYQFLLLWQSSLLFSKAHRNRSWTFLLESCVVLHAVLVAVIQSYGAVLQFGFGFLLILVLNQFWGLPAVRRYLYPSSLNGELDKKRYTISVLVVVSSCLVPMISLLAAGEKEVATAFLICSTIFIVCGVEMLLFRLFYSFENRSSVFIYSASLFCFLVTYAATILFTGKPDLARFNFPKHGERFYVEYNDSSIF